MPQRFYTWGIVVLSILTGCSHQHPQDENAPAEEPVSITRWTEKTELFVEFPPLLVGKETVFAAHVTDLENFKPVSEGSLRISLTPSQGKKIIAEAKSATVPGIYRPVLKIDWPGSYRLAFDRYRPGTDEIYDTIEAGKVEVVENRKVAKKSEATTQAKAITFLKEQQWRMDFATAPVGEKELSVLLNMSAEVKPAATGQVQIVAPVGGRLMTAASGVPTPGQKVKQGEELAVILPLPSKNRVELDAEVRAVKSELEAAENELQRVEELYKDRIVPRKRLEQSQRDVAVHKARLGAAQSQIGLLDGSRKSALGSHERFSLRSPISGTVVAASITPGAQVEVGQNLLSVIDLDRLWIEGRLFEHDIRKVRKFERGWFTANALAEPFILVQPKARLVNIGSVVDPATRSIPFILEARNEEGRLKIGFNGDLAIQTGEKIRDLAVPLSAIVDDKGVSIAFVQAEGESFERRELELGIRTSDYAQVKSGLKPGERIVIKGAYRVHLASLSSQLPAHGHAH
jgi:cobalt-zinc-cadmium efflux system membrane fusion protein